MARYKTGNNGVWDRDNNEFIIQGNSEKWQRFLAWQAEGNLPDPEFSDLEQLEQAKEQKRQEIEAAYIAAESVPVTVGAYSFQGGESAAIDIDRIIRGAELLGLSDCDIPDIDGLDRTLALNDARAVLLAILSALRPLTKKRRKLLHDVKQAGNAAEVELITW